MQKAVKVHHPDGPRQDVLKSGSIRFQETSVGCFVLNISVRGAGLVVEGEAAIPFSFELEIDDERTRRHCLVVWRNDRQVGVSFNPDRHPQGIAPARL